MSVRYYDEALLDKIKGWVGDTKISISGPDDKTSLWMKIADEGGQDKIKLPIVSLIRGNDITILQMQKKPMSYDGFKYKSSREKIEQLNGIPISIPYQFDIYTRHRKENDDLWREFVFKFVNHPKLDIEIPYKNIKIWHTSNVRLNETVSDNSDIPEHLINGEFWRTTLSLYVDDAYLFDYRIRDTLKIMLDYDDETGNITTITAPEEIAEIKDNDELKETK